MYNATVFGRFNVVSMTHGYQRKLYLNEIENVLKWNKKRSNTNSLTYEVSFALYGSVWRLVFSSSRAIVCQNNSIYAVFLIPLTDLTIVITTIIELNVNIIVKIDALFLCVFISWANISRYLLGSNIDFFGEGILWRWWSMWVFMWGRILLKARICYQQINFTSRTNSERR